MELKTKKLFRDSLIIAGFDIHTSLRNTRAFFATIVYSFSALLTGLIMVEIENKLRLDLTSLKFTEKVGDLISSLTGKSIDAVNYLLQIPLIVIVFFGFSLTFLPLFIAFTTHDQISGEFQRNSIRYTILRAERVSFVLGKIIGQFILFLGITIIANVVIFTYASWRIGSFDEIAGIKYLCLFFFYTAVMGLSYLALMTFLSTISRNPNIILLLSLIVLIILSILSRFDYVKWISLSTYKSDLWSNEPLSVLTSLLVYIGFAIVFGIFAYLNLRRKDL